MRSESWTFIWHPNVRTWYVLVVPRGTGAGVGCAGVMMRPDYLGVTGPQLGSRPASRRLDGLVVLGCVLCQGVADHRLGEP